MKRSKKIIILLLLIIILPLGLLSYFGNRLHQQEQLMLDAKFEKHLSSKLLFIDNQISDYFLQLQKQLLKNAKELSVINLDQKNSLYATNSLRDFLRKSAYVRNIYISNNNYERVFPPVRNISNKEKTFLSRTKKLWQDVSIFHINEKEQKTIKSKTDSDFISYAEQKTLNIQQQINQSGWKVWYADLGISLIFWLKDNNDNLFAYEIESVRLISDIINLLPTKNSKNNDHELIRLLDEKNNVIYLLGQEKVSHSDLKVNRYLSHPLGSWKLEYFANNLSEQKTQNLVFILTTIILALVLIGLAVYLFKEQQREANIARQRVNFVNKVSHELKTPLTSIRMYAELLDEHHYAKQDKKTSHYLNVITTESQRLSRLIENVLNFSRTQNKKIKLHKKQGIVDELIERTITAFQPVLDAKSMIVKFYANAQNKAYIDNEVIEQILVNLLSNCEKYASDGKKIEISSRLLKDFCEIRVRDFGPGISKGEKKKIFKQFYRTSSKLTDGVTGTGIGLSIAKELALLHGGDLLLETIDKGACFLLTIDITKP